MERSDAGLLQVEVGAGAVAIGSKKAFLPLLFYVCLEFQID
jgi:hypothetical protein